MVIICDSLLKTDTFYQRLGQIVLINSGRSGGGRKRPPPKKKKIDYVLFCSALYQNASKQGSDSTKEQPNPIGLLYTGWPPPQKKKNRNSRFFRTLLWSTVIFFNLLDRASFPHYKYNNTKIIKFGWELFILWVISYGLSFLGFPQFPEFQGTINDSFGRP